MNLPKPVNNLASLQGFHDQLESHMRALQSLGKPSDTYCAMLTPGKAPSELKKQFSRDHNSGDWTIREVMTSILKEIRVLEVGHYSNSFSKEHYTTTASFHTTARKSIAQREKKEPACSYCKGAHTANQCTVIKGHHTSLCPPTDAKPPLPPSQMNNSVQPTNSTRPPPLPATNIVQVPAFTAVANSPPSHVSIRNVCLLKTAIATASARPISIEGNIFFDEGTQHSFISQDLADRLCLKATHTEQISLTSFGNTVSATRSLQVASISVHTQDQSAIPMSVLVVPKLAAPLQNSICMEIRNVPYLKDLILSHPVTEDENFESIFLWGLILLDIRPRPHHSWQWPYCSTVLLGLFTLWPSVTFICSGIPCSCQLYCYGQPGPGHFLHN